jgi:hypothetical protein
VYFIVISLFSFRLKNNPDHIHTLDTIPKNYYLELEMCRETTRWEDLSQRLKVTFTFEHESPSTDAMLHAI